MTDNPEKSPSASLKTSLRACWVVGLTTVILCFGGFGVWASKAVLSSASIASGIVSPDGSQRIIQHLEGGIVSAINVREGQLVKKGQKLIVLDRALAEANQQSRFRMLQRLRVVRDRLIAQEQQRDTFEPILTPGFKRDATFEQFLEYERASLLLKNRAIREQEAIYGQQIIQVESEIVSLNAQATGLDDQLKYLRSELEDKKTLIERGLVRKPELYALQRKEAELVSGKSALVSNISRASQKIEEIKLANLSMKTANLDEVSARLSDINTEIAQAEEAFAATDDVLSRTEINSPIDGRVLVLNFKTIGGVVGPGQPIMTIVPANEELIVDAKLSPKDIDNVALGMKANVQLSSFLSRHMQPLKGEVFQIGADAQLDEDTRERYYSIRVKVDKQDEQMKDMGIELQAGMPAEVFIQTGEHTPMRYLFDPIARSFNRAFREETM